MDKQINQFPIISQLNGNELFPLWGGGTSKSTSIYKLRNYVLDNLTVKAGDNINKTGNPQVKIENNEIIFDYLKGEKGDSAYKQALDAGFDGTEDEFKLALKNIKEQIVVDVEQIEDSEDIKVRENRLYLVEEAKRALFIDMWNDAWKITCYLNYEESKLHNQPKTQYILGKYDPENTPDPSKPFRAYDDVWLTYEEAVQVMNEYKWGKGQGTLNGILQCGTAKVAVPFICGNSPMSISGLTYFNKSIEEMAFLGGVPYNYWASISSITVAFCSPKLRKIHGTVRINSSTTMSFPFSGASRLESVHINGLSTSIDLRYCQSLNLDSFQYLISNANNTKAITITVHADVYAKLTGDTTNAAAAALSEEELEQWMSLVPLAKEKNITFNILK